MDKKELKKDLIELHMKVVFNPTDSNQVELMEKLIEIFNKYTSEGD